MLNDEVVSRFELGSAGTLILSGFIGIVVLLVFGEITPMTIAYIHCDAWSKRVATPVYMFRRILAPVLNVVSALCDIVLDLLGRAEVPPLSHEEYISYIDSGMEQGVFTSSEGALMKEVFSLRETSVKAVMCPRTDLVHITYDMPPEEVARKIRSSRQVFMPLSRGSLDESDSLLDSRMFFTLDRIDRMNYQKSRAVSKAVFIPDTSTLEKALATMRSCSISAAFAADEYGSLNGLVTIQDIYSELAGVSVERGSGHIRRQTAAGPDVWIIDGMTPLDEVRENTVWHTCNLDDRYKSNTLSGLFCEVAGALPAPGDIVTVDDIELKAVSVSRNRITQVRIRPLSAHGFDSASLKEEASKP